MVAKLCIDLLKLPLRLQQGRLTILVFRFNNCDTGQQDLAICSREGDLVKFPVGVAAFFFGRCGC